MCHHVLVPLQVDACAPRARFSGTGIAACDLDTNTPGTYYLDFSILDTATTVRITRTRTVIVLKRCFPSEPRCLDQSCGGGGTCIGGELVLPVNTEPTIELTRSASQDAYGVVQISLGTAYEACAPGQVGTSFTVLELAVEEHMPFLCARTMKKASACMFSRYTSCSARSPRGWRDP